jgi:TolB-like protein
MKPPIRAVFSCCFFLLISVMPIFNLGLDAREPPKRVAILPFAMHAQQEMDYLRDGIVDMLATRLYWKDKVTVIEKDAVRKAMADHPGAVDRGYAEALGKQLGADYVLFGSVTVFGDSMSLDATMESITGKEAPITVYSQTKGMASVIPEINTFAQKINTEIFGRPEAAAQAGALPSQPASQAVQTTPPQSPEASPLNPAFKQHQRMAGAELSYWKSQIFRTEITGMDIGDVDGDGRNEMVLMVGTEIVVYRFQDQRLLKLAAFAAPDRERFLAVDVADINHNGRAEIFASKVNGTSVTSMVLELDGGTLKVLESQSSWFFRVMAWPGKGRILLGQERMFGEIGQAALAGGVFRKGIYELAWNGARYVKAGEAPILDLPDVYIYNFAIGELSGDGRSEVVMIDKFGALRVLDLGGEVLYKGTDSYGGTLNFMVTNPNANETTGPERKYVFLPARILIADLDQNGRKEIIVSQNQSALGDFAERFRAYSDGRVVSLSWTGLSLDINWESQKLSGALSDYQIQDLDNDGKPDLVVALLQERAVAFKDAKSRVVSYPLSLGKGGVGGGG